MKSFWTKFSAPLSASMVDFVVLCSLDLRGSEFLFLAYRQLCKLAKHSHPAKDREPHKESPAQKLTVGLPFDRVCSLPLYSARHL